MREQPKPESTDEAESIQESEYDEISKSMRESKGDRTIPQVISAVKSISQKEESILGEEMDVDIPFRTPPKTLSGNTIAYA